jgi:hypothetical protein
VKNWIVFLLFISAAFYTTAFAERIPNQLGLDWRTEGPNGKKWAKVTDIHYLDKNSVKKVKDSIYQAKLCNEVNGPGFRVWNYFNVRVDFKSRQAYSESRGKWIGPMSPTNYDEAVLKYLDGKRSN